MCDFHISSPVIPVSKPPIIPPVFIIYTVGLDGMYFFRTVFPVEAQTAQQGRVVILAMAMVPVLCANLKSTPLY